MATNRGFRMRDGQMVIYEQQKLGLSAYGKRWVLPDGIHTEPIDFTFSSHQPEEEWCLEGQPAVLHAQSPAWA